MSCVYQSEEYYDEDDDDHHRDDGVQAGSQPGQARYHEPARLGIITNTIITTLSQDNLFSICLVMVEVLGVILIALVTSWMMQLGGFGLSKEVVFNFHPLCMTVGIIFLNANGILIYRAFSFVGYQKLKIMHFSVQSAAIGVSWLGFSAAYSSHTQQDIPHFYSLHSWLGLTSLVGVTISLVSSYATFLWPKANGIYRRLALPFHVFGGITNIALSAAICAMGTTEKAIFSLNSKPNVADRYPSLPSVAIILNCFGCILAVFTILVVWMVTKPEFKRRAKMTINTPHYALRREKTID